MIEFKYDTQLLIEGENLKKEEISKHINKNLKGDCLIVVQVGNLVKIHFHTLFVVSSKKLYYYLYDQKEFFLLRLFHFHQ